MSVGAIIAIGVVALFILLAPLIPWPRDDAPPSKGEDAVNWIDAVLQTIGGLWPWSR